jgi:hypothetical protein
MNQLITVRVNEEITSEIKLGRGVRQGCCLSPTLFNIYLDEILREALEGQGGVNVGGRQISYIAFADDKALLAENERELQEMLRRVNNTLQEYGMKINVNKTKVMEVAKKRKKIKIKVSNETIEQVRTFKYLGSTVNEECKCENEIKSRIAMGKTAFNKRKDLFCGPLKTEIRKRLIKCFVWSTVLYGSETWTIRKADERRLEAFEMWTWRRMEKIKWTDKVSNKKVLEKVGEERQLIRTIRKRKSNWIGHILRGEGIIRQALEGTVKGRTAKGRRRMKLVDELKRGVTYAELKVHALDREQWRLMFSS